MLDPNRPSRPAILRLAWVFYLPMILAGAFAREPGALRVGDWARLAQGTGAALAVAGLTIAASRWLGRHTAWGRALRAEFHQVLGRLESRQILTVSLLSAFGEEMLFRGVLQAWLGLWWTSLLFGVFHFPVRRRLIPWSVFAGLLGLVLGGLTEWTRTIWPAILLHFAINYYNIHDLAEGGDATGHGLDSHPR